MNNNIENETKTLKRVFIALGVVAVALFFRDINDTQNKARIDSEGKVETCFNVAKQKNDPDWINACSSIKKEHIDKYGRY